MPLGELLDLLAASAIRSGIPAEKTKAQNEADFWALMGVS